MARLVLGDLGGEAQADRYAVRLLGEWRLLASALEAIVTKPQSEGRRG